MTLLTPTSKNHHQIINNWLLGLCGLLIAMIMLGGATRLTRSGLSITEWKPFTGIIPPLSMESWQIEFGKYKQTPEYNLINQNMTLSDFKFIFFMEYSHRLFGRLIGLYILAPFIYWSSRSRLPRPLKKHCLILLILGGLQGALGWYMVKSGLNQDPHVSHYRLSAHLLMAFGILSYIIWIIHPTYKMKKNHNQNKNWATINFILILITVFYGALVAGLKAGLIYNTFPLMEGQIFPSEIFHFKPFWKNFTDNHATVQFIHRTLACSTLAMVSFGVFKGFAPKWYLLILFIQVVLGIITLLYQVPVSFGTLHQGWAAVVFCATTWVYLNNTKK